MRPRGPETVLITARAATDADVEAVAGMPMLLLYWLSEISPSILYYTIITCCAFQRLICASQSTLKRRYLAVTRRAELSIVGLTYPVLDPDI